MKGGRAARRHDIPVGRVGRAAEAFERGLVNHFGHAVKIDQQAEEYFVCRRAVLVDAAKIAQNGDVRDIFSVERKHARRLLAHGRGPFRRGNMSMDTLVLMLAVVGRCNFCQQPGHHLDDVSDGHSANLIFMTSFRHLQ